MSVATRSVRSPAGALVTTQARCQRVSTPAASRTIRTGSVVALILLRCRNVLIDDAPDELRNREAQPLRLAP